MPRCQFIYIRTRVGNLTGGQCENEAVFLQNTLCGPHRHFHGRAQRGEEIASDPLLHHMQPPTVSSSGFPRLYSAEEVREWVNEARRRTSPVFNWKRGCVICGRATGDRDMIAIALSDLVIVKDLLKDTLATFLKDVDPILFRYAGVLAALDGLPIDRNGLLTSDEIIVGADDPVFAKGCQDCCMAIRKRRIPQFALGNRLWTGIDVETLLTDLSWIEEKLIAWVHVSVQVQKCRMFNAWAADGFHPQRQVQGHILSYPMEPTMVLQRLPLSPNRLVGLIKVVFVSKRRISQQEAINLRFYVVRQEKVANALRWLIEHNPQYRDIELDEDAVAQLPTNGIPDAVYEHFTFSDQVDADAAGHSRYDMSDQGRIGPISPNDELTLVEEAGDEEERTSVHEYCMDVDAQAEIVQLEEDEDSAMEVDGQTETVNDRLCPHVRC